MSSIEVLLTIASSARLFHATDGTAFADLVIDGHRETWPLRSKRFRAWLRQRYYEPTWDAPEPGGAERGAQSARGAGAIRWSGAQRSTSGSPSMTVSIYLDLADEFWRSGRNWARRLAGLPMMPPVRFRRPAGMLPLPIARARRRDRRIGVVPQPAQPGRLCPGRRLAVGGAAARWSLPAAGAIGRAGVGEDRALEDAAGAGRSQRRPGAGAATRRARTLHRRQQRPCAGFRQPSALAALAVRYALPARRAAAASQSASSTPTRTRCCSRPPGQSFSTASRTSSPGPISPTAPFC